MSWAGDEAVQRVVGVKGLVLGLARAVAPHILINHVAVGVVTVTVPLYSLTQCRFIDSAKF